MEKVHKNIIASGKVQGVGFRYACLNSARGIGIKGFVKNLSDGTVYIEAEGSPQQIILFIKWCHEGPSHSRVTNLNIENSKFCNFNHFEIKH